MCCVLGFKFLISLRDLTIEDEQRVRDFIRVCAKGKGGDRDSANITIEKKSASANTCSQMSGVFSNYLLSNVRICV